MNAPRRGSNGSVDFGDILAILTEWGPCEGECPEDLDDSGAVDFGAANAGLLHFPVRVPVI